MSPWKWKGFFPAKSPGKASCTIVLWNLTFLCQMSFVGDVLMKMVKWHYPHIVIQTYCSSLALSEHLVHFRGGFISYLWLPWEEANREAFLCGKTLNVCYGKIWSSISSYTSSLMCTNSVVIPEQCDQAGQSEYRVRPCGMAEAELSAAALAQALIYIHITSIHILLSIPNKMLPFLPLILRQNRGKIGG